MRLVPNTCRRVEVKRFSACARVGSRLVRPTMSSVKVAEWNGASFATARAGVVGGWAASGAFRHHVRRPRARAGKRARAARALPNGEFAGLASRAALLCATEAQQFLSSEMDPSERRWKHPRVTLYLPQAQRSAGPPCSKSTRKPGLEHGGLFWGSAGNLLVKSVDPKLYRPIKRRPSVCAKPSA